MCISNPEEDDELRLPVKVDRREIGLHVLPTLVSRRSAHPQDKEIPGFRRRRQVQPEEDGVAIWISRRQNVVRPSNRG